jgi:type IV pilus assembly protein PilY1
MQPAIMKVLAHHSAAIAAISANHTNSLARPAQELIMKTSTLKNMLTIAACSLLLGSPLSVPRAVADDMLIYLDQLSLPPEQIRPNLMFVLDTSGSMGLSMSDASSLNSLTGDYNSSTSYPGKAYFSGGAGDPDYYYIYSQPDTYADQWIYYNKVHKDQLTTSGTYSCGTPNPYTSKKDIEFGTATGGPNMCYYADESCGFDVGPSGDTVYCDTGTTNYRLVNANFHNWAQAFYRYTVLETVMRQFIDKNPNINMSVMRFNDEGGYLIKESVHAADDTGTNQTALTNAINDIYLFGNGTPLSESLWEAYRYLTGKTADYGNDSGTTTPSAAYSSGSTYNSPIDYACQKTSVLILTDGAPSGDTGRDSNIASLIGSSCSGSCLDEFSTWIGKNGAAERDHDTSLIGTQPIKVYTVGFGAPNSGNYDETLMKNAAEGSGGSFYPAATADELLEALLKINNQVEYESDTAVAPSVAVNTYSGLENRDELYYSLYKPAGTPRWTGNVKKYKLVDGKITAANNVDAIAADGTFNTTARSFWTDTNVDFNDDTVVDALDVDGNEIEWGGFAYELKNPTEAAASGIAPRKMYTYTGSAPEYSFSAPTPVSLNNEALNVSNSNIDPLLGSGISATDADNIITWARGGTGAAPNYFVGDIIHNPPSVVTYTTSIVNGEPVFDDTLFAASNLGVLHAIDPDDGRELFSYVPKEMLPNLTTYYKDTGGFTDKVYGLDAPMTVWRYDADRDGTINSSDGDFVHIYQGMRRGGTYLYGFNMTDRSDPKLMWQLRGTALDPTPSGTFADLAQTWSSPQKTYVNECSGGSCSKREVLVFGGGYDPSNDFITSKPTSSKGNAIFMIDAKTSELLWSAGKTGHNFNSTSMTQSFAAEVSSIDINGDQVIDFLYAIDVFGQLWRIDFDDSYDESDKDNFAVGGGVIADFGGSGSAGFRHFYNNLSVAFFAPRGQQPLLTISVASGHRADPRETTIDDRLYVLYDYNVLNNPTSYNYVNATGIVEESDLTHVTNVTTTNTIGEYGWYFSLDSQSGEKGLSKVTTFDGVLIFTTYIPEFSSANICEGGTGGGLVYALDALTGFSQLKDGVTIGNTVESMEVAGSGIASNVTSITRIEEKCVANCDDEDDTNDEFEDDTTTYFCTGTFCFELGYDVRLKKSYWREN